MNTVKIILFVIGVIGGTAATLYWLANSKRVREERERTQQAWENTNDMLENMLADLIKGKNSESKGVGLQ